MAKWKGTTVPNTGVVEKVYFNTNLSIDEVRELLSKLTYTATSSNVLMYHLFYSTTPSPITISVLYNAEVDGYRIMKMQGGATLFADEQYCSYNSALKPGWNSSLVTEETFSFIDNSVTVDYFGVYGWEGHVGFENHIIASLFSTTPFVEVEDYWLNKPVDKDWLQKMFINEAKPALERHSGGETIPDGYILPEGTIEITENGSHDVTKYANAEVNTPQLNLGSGYVELNNNGTHNINANEEGLDGYITVEVLVNVQPDLQEKTVTENGVVLPDEGYDGLSKVIVEVSSGGESVDVGGIIDRSVTTLSIPNGTTKIGANVFNGCAQLQSIEIPSSVTTIEDYAFYNCKSLKSIEIPYGVTFIGPSAFMFCENAASISIADSVTTIERSAFSDCESLNSIVFPNLITKLASSILSGCEKLTSVTIPNGVTEIESYAFSNCSMLASINLPSSLKTIGDGAFRQCESLTSIEIPYGVTIIPTQLFQQCTKLTSATFPNSVTTINDYVFSSCSSLTNLTIPSSVTSIQNGALQIGSTSKKATIRFEGITPPTLSSSSVFKTSYLSKIEVPSPAVNVYKSATNWSSVSSYIKGYNGLFDVPKTEIYLDSEPTVSFVIPFGATSPTFDIVCDNDNICTATIDNTGFVTITGVSKGLANVTVTMIDGGVTYTRSFEVKVYETSPYRVENISEAEYGFELNSNGYYESTNKGVDDSYALCKVSFTADGSQHLYLDCINYAEGGSDYGILSKIDTQLERDSDSNSDSYSQYFKKFSSWSTDNKESVQTVDYGVIPSGEHFIEIKFVKDSSSANYNDSLQFKVRLE